MRTAKPAFTFFLTLFLLSSMTAAQDWDTAWTQVYWRDYFDSLNWMDETSDNGFIMVGVTRLDGQVDDDIRMIKTDCHGVEEWSVIYGEPEYYENGYHVLQTGDGGYFISAKSDRTGSVGAGGVWAIRTNSAGDTLWTYAWCPDDRTAEPHYAIETAEGRFALAGMINLANGTYNQAFILVLNADGTTYDWQDYGDSWYQDAWWLTQMGDGGYIFTGHWDDHYGNLYVWWARRVDAGLNTVWDSTYAITDYYDEIHSSCRDAGGIVLVGEGANVGHVMKIDFDGHTLWSKPMSVTPYAEGYDAICPTDDGGYMVGGWYTVPGNRRDFAYLRLDSNGDTLWTFTVGGSQDDHGQAIVQTYDGNFALAGPSATWVNGQCWWLTKIEAPCCKGRVGAMSTGTVVTNRQREMPPC